MLRTKLFRGFAIVVILFGALSLYLGVRTINRRVIDEAQTRVRLDINSARALFNSKEAEIESVVKLVSYKELVVDCCENQTWTNADLHSRLERIRVNFRLDFLDVVSPDGLVVVRTTSPYRTGDSKQGDAAVASAINGRARSCLAVLSRSELDQEAEGLADRAFIQLEETPHARRSLKKEETRGLVMVAAAPVERGGRVIGAIYGGVLLNRNMELIDRIQSVVFENELYNGMPLGTATIFLDDARIITTVKLANGNRAIGTRVSKEVADKVLDNAQPWVGEAFVVKDWYLTTYEPIRDGFDRVVGMLYVGILRRPFDDAARMVALKFALATFVALLVALVLAFVTASRVARPIHGLVTAANRMSNGHRPGPVPVDNVCDETDRLITAFNDMTRTLAEREERLAALNRSYMDTLGFVSHELKGPVASMVNYVYLMRQLKLGPLTEKQDKAMRAVDVNCTRVVEMVRHYLNLSRIENGELQPVRTRVAVLNDVVHPILESLNADITAHEVKVDNRVAPDVAVSADLNMALEVFENLVGNAIKYGRRGGTITLDARAGDRLVTFSVRNEGEGIPADRLGDLFKKFSRIKGDASAHQHKGTGLGLFITRHIVEAHGGTIEVESHVHEWTEFRFTLPAVASGDAGSRGAA